jgi:hypothetical protein
VPGTGVVGNGGVTVVAGADENGAGGADGTAHGEVAAGDGMPDGANVDGGVAGIVMPPVVG